MSPQYYLHNLSLRLMFPTVDLNVLIVGNVLLFGNFSVFGKLLLLSKKIGFCVSRELY